jgi:hypothetical protein
MSLCRSSYSSITITRSMRACLQHDPTVWRLLIGGGVCEFSDPTFPSGHEQRLCAQLGGWFRGECAQLGGGVVLCHSSSQAVDGSAALHCAFSVVPFAFCLQHTTKTDKSDNTGTTVVYTRTNNTSVFDTRAHIPDLARRTPRTHELQPAIFRE